MQNVEYVNNGVENNFMFEVCVHTKLETENIQAFVI